MFKKVIIQFIIAAGFSALTIYAANYVVLQENFELLKFSLYRSNVNVLTFVNDNKVLFIDMLIGILYFILFGLTAIRMEQTHGMYILRIVVILA